jgi:hypothetical protein
MLDLIGFTEASDKRDGYNETLAYSAVPTGDVKLAAMMLKELDAFQTKMPRYPKNELILRLRQASDRPHAACNIHENLLLSSGGLQVRQVLGRGLLHVLGTASNSQVSRRPAGRVTDATHMMRYSGEYLRYMVETGFDPYKRF